jgi:hypothetical protein
MSQKQKKVSQKYQNQTKFKLREDCKLAQKLQKSTLQPLDFLCQRCFDQVKWKLDYNKYKPLSQHAKCEDCGQKKVTKAYRILCDQCCTLKRDVPCLKKEFKMSQVLEESDESAIKEMFELKSLKRCSKCSADVENYAVKELS